MGKYTGILLVSDWDRTVTGPDRKVPPANTEAVLRFIAEGGMISIATGHTRVSHRSRWAELPTNAPHIVFNGAEIYDYRSGQSLWQGALPDSAEGLFASLLEKHPELHFEIQCPTETYVFGMDMGLAEIMKRMGVPIREAPLEAVPRPRIQFAVSGSPGSSRRAEPGEQEPDWFRYSNEEIEALFGGIAAEINAPGTRCRCSRSLPFLIEAQAEGCTKGETARRLLRMLGCHTLVCCGDAMNDLSLLRAADRAFVAGDGARELLDMGFEVAAPSDKGVLADAISRL
jgi:hydroxymethylpyrimidine pyrophosphatase-like HAD family hydrolase